MPRLTPMSFPRLLLIIITVALVVAGYAWYRAPLVAFLGDSLTEGWGLTKRDAYPAVVARGLAERGQRIRVLNAGVGGDTVSQGRARLAGVLRRRPDVLVVALGINDALRGMSVEAAENDLREIVADARTHGATVVLVGVRTPPSLATSHARRFEAMYGRLAADLQISFVPDLLAGAAGNPERMFPDALHPNAAGQRRLAENVRPALESVLAGLAKSGYAPFGNDSDVRR